MRDVGVVVPVFRGEHVLGRSLRSLARQRLAGSGIRLHVVVAVNDGRRQGLDRAIRLAEVFRGTGMIDHVIATPPGRAAAFGESERLLPEGPRIHLDQDAILSPTGVVTLANALDVGTGIHFATGRLRIASGSSRAVVTYYGTWRRLPYVRCSPASAGMYAFSAAGRRRWGEWPSLHSDDKWVRLHFAPAERRRLQDVGYEVCPPDRLAALVAARRRYAAGNRELAVSASPELVNDRRRYAGIVGEFASRPGHWPGLGLLLGVHGLAATLATVDRIRVRDGHG